MDIITNAIFIVGLLITGIGLVVLARRMRERELIVNGAAKARLKTNYGGKPALIAVTAFATLSLVLGLVGIERSGISHVEVYVPGIDLPADISEPPPRKDLASTVSYHLHVEPHPPGYFILMWFWTKLVGTSLMAIRFPSVLFGALAVFLIYAVAVAECRRVTIGLIAAGLLALNGHQVFWMQAARMFEMALCLGLLSTWLWIRMIRSRRDEPVTEVAYVLATLAGVYSQIFFWLLLAAQMLFTGIRFSANDGGPSRTYFIQTLCVIIGTPMWAHALYIGTAVNSGRDASLSFAQDFLNFGFLYTPLRANEIPLWLELSLTLVALLCVAAYLRYPDFRWKRTDGVAMPKTGYLFIIGFGIALIIFAYSRTALRRNALLAVVSLAPLMVAVHVVLLHRLRDITRWIDRRMSGVWSPLVNLPLVMLVLVFVIGIVQPIAVSRGMLVAVPSLLIILAGGLYAINQRSRTIGAIALIAVLVACVGSLRYFQEGGTFSLRDYRGVATQMAARFEPDDLIFVNNRDWMTTPIFYHLTGKHDRLVAEDYSETIDRTKSRRVWLLWFPQRKTASEIEEALKDYHVTETFSGLKIRFALYERATSSDQAP